MITFNQTKQKILSKITQIQSGKVAGHGQVLYSGPMDCARQLIKEGGISSLYRGFGATFVRGFLIHFKSFRRK